MNATLNCHCGHRIFSRDVMQHGLYVRDFASSFVYVRFRCSRCKKLGEHYVKQEDWDESILRDAVCEVTPDERRRFQDLGGISLEEMASFHHELDSLESLPQFAEE